MTTRLALPATTMDALRDEIARLRAHLAEYVGYEPTVREEMRHLADTLDCLERVVIQHIADGLASDDIPLVAAVMALATDLDLAGLNVDREVEKVRSARTGAPANGWPTAVPNQSGALR